MKVKEFFKPTKLKIIIAIVLFLLLPIPYKFLILGGPDECGGARTCILGEEYSWTILGGFILIFAIFSRGNQPFETTTDYLWKVPYLVVASYILACCIVYLFKKLKTKK